MILFSIENLTIEEIAAMRQALNVIDIKGSSAQFIASLQNKLDSEINTAHQILKQDEAKKSQGVVEIEKTPPVRKSTHKTKS
tara:strand:- start:136 stop:381 length:246 start_codon:yes stop_codon:yes gene_type:complete